MLQSVFPCIESGKAWAGGTVALNRLAFVKERMRAVSMNENC